MLINDLVILTSERVLAGEARQVDVVLYHHDVAHLEQTCISLIFSFPLSLTVNMLFSPPPALVAIRVSTPISFITLTGMAVCNN